MKNLFDLLGKFSKSLNKDIFIKETISQIIQSQTKVNLSPEKIILKDGLLEIEASPAAQNEIALKETFILEEIKSQKIFISRILYK